MFAVYNYEVTDKVYIFDNEDEAKRCECMLQCLNSYNNNTKNYDCTFVDDNFETYAEIKDDQLDLLSSIGEGELMLVYRGNTELIRV